MRQEGTTDMRKGTIIAFILGWALAIAIGPRDVIAMFRGKS